MDIRVTYQVHGVGRPARAPEPGRGFLGDRGIDLSYPRQPGLGHAIGQSIGVHLPDPSGANQANI